MKTLTLLLTNNVDNLGIVGDVVTVKPGYARNFLLPHGLATDPTETNIKRLATLRENVKKEMSAHRHRLEDTLAGLAGCEISIMRSANEQGVLFGGVSQHDIGEALRMQGFAIEDRAVRAGEQVKRLDSYAIPIVLAADLKTEIKLWVVSDKPPEDLAIADQDAPIVAETDDDQQQTPVAAD